MAKYISLGEYNKQYKYIWIYLILRFIYIFTFSNKLVFDQITHEVLELPYGPFLYIQFDYITFIIISSILIAFKKYRQKKQESNQLIQELIFNKTDIEIEYGVEQSDYFLFINLFFVVLKDLFEETTHQFNCLTFSFWMFEMLYYELFHSRLFNTKIYKHHKFSFIFILSSCSLLKIIVIILNCAYETNYAKFFENRKWLIPISIIIYFLFRVFRAFTYSNEKYYLEKRIISIPNYMLIYGIIGLITTSICALITTFVPCGEENTIPELSKKVCELSYNNIYYFDSYRIYYKKLYAEYFGARLILLIIKSILNFHVAYFIYVIYKKLSPIYYLCMHRFDFLIITILAFLNNLINKHIEGVNITIKAFDILTLIFYILGSLVYLEFIELNFCNLNFYTKRNIKERSNKDTRISLGEVSINSEIDEK